MLLLFSWNDKHCQHLHLPHSWPVILLKWFFKWDPGRTSVLASPGILLQMLSPGPYPRPTEPGSLEWGPAIHVLTNLPGNSDAGSSLRTNVKTTDLSDSATVSVSTPCPATQKARSVHEGTTYCSSSKLLGGLNSGLRSCLVASVHEIGVILLLRCSFPIMTLASGLRMHWLFQCLKYIRVFKGWGQDGAYTTRQNSMKWNKKVSKGRNTCSNPSGL